MAEPETTLPEKTAEPAPEEPSKIEEPKADEPEAKADEPEPEPVPLEKVEAFPKPASSRKEPVAAVAVEAEPTDKVEPAKKPSEKPSDKAIKKPWAEGGALAAYEALAKLSKLSDVVAVALKITGEAATARRTEWSFAAKVAEAVEEAGLARSDADTPFGNALKVLESGPEGDAERALASAVAAHVVAETDHGDEYRLAGDILWLATHTAFDATPLLARALGEDADELYAEIGDRVKRIDEGKGGALGRAEGIVGCAVLAAAGATRHLGTLKDPALARIVAGAVPAKAPATRIEGDAVAGPRGPVVTTLLAVTGILFVMHAARFVGRAALAYRRPTEITLSADGVRVRTRTEMLGKTLRDREHVILRAGLVRVVREVRYPRAAFYAGLLALVIGSYVGVRALVDGARAASPALLLAGVVVIGLGIAADFALGTLLPGSRGKCRIGFVPRKGRAVWVGEVDVARADEAIARALSAK